MSRNRVRSNALALLACLTFLLASFGCSDPGSITAPDSASHSAVVDNPNFVRILSSSSKGASDPYLTASAVSAVISADEGGSLTNGRVTLVFPAGALDKDAEITIEMLGENTLGVELGPHGMQFNKPVVMSMNLLGTTAEGMAEKASTLWLNEAFDRWERVEKVYDGNPDAGSSQLHHFSKYSGGVDG